MIVEIERVYDRFMNRFSLIQRCCHLLLSIFFSCTTIFIFYKLFAYLKSFLNKKTRRRRCFSYESSSKCFMQIALCFWLVSLLCQMFRLFPFVFFFSLLFLFFLFLCILCFSTLSLFQYSS